MGHQVSEMQNFTFFVGRSGNQWSDYTISSLATGKNFTRTSGFSYIAHPLKTSSMPLAKFGPGTASRSNFHNTLAINTLICHQAISLPAHILGPWLNGWNPALLSSANLGSKSGLLSSLVIHRSGRNCRGSWKFLGLRAKVRRLD